ncbi:glycogen/starch synthase [Candidatus Omnitrophus magneticus]|uniref:Glycogen synthase n=1 Tax=Candidatus Omnitrophus magneticus TaxID=1609969 RepID=A0A0F0CNR9_9BACT|nr:glycogen/starch synthase [Candidatus Omnitrophus magneticus]
MFSDEYITSKKILFVSSEVFPFVKSGGLADVSCALPKALKKLGHDVRVVLPRYWSIDKYQYNLKPVIAPMGVQMGNCLVWCAVFESKIDDIPVYFIEHEQFFGRSGIYDDGKKAYYDNAERYGFLCKAALQLCRDINFKPDIAHSNDWQTALLAPYLKTWHAYDSFFRNTASVFSIHNIAYQGIFHPNSLRFLGIGNEHFTESKFENFGYINFMKGALFFADAISTVSPSYAREILAEPGGNGLGPYLKRRHEDLHGILNGVDYDCWNPETDTIIPAKYSLDDMSGKAECKKALQREFWLRESPNVPIFGIVARFTPQKGLQLLAPIIEKLVTEMLAQFVFLGSGEKNLEDFFGGLPAKHPGTIGAWIGYNNYKAHLIESGADFFLMPSLYEPCGLNQIYSMKYGTLPIVRKTGGLNDTVWSYNEQTGEGTGFCFDAIDPYALYYTIGWAVSTYYDRPEHMRNMKKLAMSANFSWQTSAEQYSRLYEKAINRRNSWW